MVETREVFLRFSVEKLEQLGSRIHDCLERLSGEQIWIRGSGSQNAVGNLVLHLTGNVRQWIVSGIGGAAYIRERDKEFSASGGLTGDELWRPLEETLREAAAVIRSVTPERLVERIRVQKYDVTVLEAIYHVVEHFAQHTGQIIFATKILTGAELGYYQHLKQPAHGEKTP